MQPTFYRALRIGATAALLVPTLAVAAAEPAPATLPGGATSLTEAFSDWQVGCVVQGLAKRCTITQKQVNQ